MQGFPDSPIICGQSRSIYQILLRECVEKLVAVVGVHLLRWILTYPVDKVIRSLNNWGQKGNLMLKNTAALIDTLNAVLLKEYFIVE